MRRSTIVFVTGVTLFLIIIIAASFVPGAVDATASETLQAECATDAANDRAEVEARQSWTPTDTPTATSTASPTPTATPTMWIECDINDIDIAAGDTMTVPYTIYSEYRGPGAHNVALSFFVDHERVALVNTGLANPSGVDSSQRVVTWQDKWNDDVHDVLLIVESSQFAPLRAECTQWFGNADFVPALECDIGATVNYSDTELTLSRTIYYTTNLDTHHVDGYFYVDNVLIYGATYNLVSNGVSTGTTVVELQPRHLVGQHEVRYVLQSEEHAPLETECTTRFGQPVNIYDYHVDSAGNIYREERTYTIGERGLGILQLFGCVPSLIMAITAFFLFIAVIVPWYRRRD